SCCFTAVEPAVFQKNLQKELRSKGGEEVLEQFKEGFEEYIEDTKRFHKSLLPSVKDTENR
ncbi:hypothetical protein MAR_011601, partial [Mya arenaria]